MDDKLIQFKEVSKKFGKKEILEKINLSIPEGKITGIIGASGEGKTTILKLIVGFYKPTQGNILYSKRHILKEKELKNIVGFSTEEGSFHSRLTVLENLYHFASLHHVPRKKTKTRAEELMNFVGLDYAKNNLAGDLSMGMKKRLDVAIALMHKPSVLIMDEPTADLDPLLRNKMLQLIKKVKKKGTTVIITTQILGDMDKICDKVAVLYDKKILCQGNPEDVKKKYQSKDLNEVFNKIFSKRTEAKTQGLSQEQINLIQDKIDLSMGRLK